AGGIGRPASFRPFERAAVGDHRSLAATAEAVAFERERDQRAERIVELRYPNVFRLKVALSPEEPRARPRGPEQRVVAEVVRHQLVLARDALRERMQVRRRMP